MNRRTLFGGLFAPGVLSSRQAIPIVPPPSLPGDVDGQIKDLWDAINGLSARVSNLESPGFPGSKPTSVSELEDRVSALEQQVQKGCSATCAPSSDAPSQPFANQPGPNEIAHFKGATTGTTAHFDFPTTGPFTIIVTSESPQPVTAELRPWIGSDTAPALARFPVPGSTPELLSYYVKDAGPSVLFVITVAAGPWDILVRR